MLGVRQRQRLLATQTRDIGSRPALLGQALHGHAEAFQVGAVEQAAQGDFQPQRPSEPGNDLGGQQGMPAQLEETIVQAHLGALQHLGPDVRQALLQGRFSGPITHRAGILFGQGQGFAVYLAIAGQRQAGQFNHLFRHHGLRQAGSQGLAYPRGKIRHSRRRHGPGQQAAFMNADTAAGNLRKGQQATVDLAQFDPVPTNLHLAIAAPIEPQSRCPTDAVAAAIEALALALGIGYEAFGGQPRLAHIPSSQAGAADVEFAMALLRHLSQAGIEHPGASARQRLTQLDHRIGRAQVGGQHPTVVSVGP